MANSGIPWIDLIFNWAVHALVWLARLLGITYEEINVWLFCVAWPLLTLALTYLCLGLSQITHFGGYHGDYAEEPSEQI